MNWYYIDGPKRVGPFTETEWDALVRQGVIQPGTRVWNEELPTWMAWSEVPRAVDLVADADEEAEADDIFTRHARRRLGETDEPGDHGHAIPGGEEWLLDPAGPDAGQLAELEQRALAPDYQIRLGPIVRRSFALLRGNLGLLAGATLLTYGMIYIGGAMPLASVFMNFIFSGVLLGGLFSLFLKRMRGQEAEIGDIFSGFRPGYLRHLARKTLLSSAILASFFLPGLIALKLVGLDLSATEPEAIFEAIVALDAFAIVLLGLLFAGGALFAVYFNICWLFAVPLIRDKGVPYREAMRLSRLRVLQHPWRISAVLLGSSLCFMAPGLFLSAAGLVVGSAVAGVLTLFSYVLLLLCLPAITAVIMAMYEEAFGAFVLPSKKAGSREPGEEAAADL